jgi:predicted nuclease of restriction endonuclease-like (RecB) superfamily
MNFTQLSELLANTSNVLYQQSVKAVNVNLTLRNWLFGYYIVEYEQNGEDRAQYGEKLMFRLAEALRIKGLTVSELSRCRQFYQAYPEILGLLTQKFKLLLPDPILGTLSQKSDTFINTSNQDHYEKVFTQVPYSHFVELIKVTDQLKRKFFELLVLKTAPSVRELRRQIWSLSYERFGLSENNNLALENIISKIEPHHSTDLVKSHYFFEFLNINKPYLVEESELEQALIDHLQEFIIELGNGFCFEARQKRILIGDEYFFIDLVFYHRILKCHVLIELKTDWVKHEHIGQLKVYLQHFKRSVAVPDDNPPVGILRVYSRDNKCSIPNEMKNVKWNMISSASPPVDPLIGSWFLVPGHWSLVLGSWSFLIFNF